MAPVDVLIIGGGIQGLVLLDQLTEHGYGGDLVTKSDLGSGPTRHSHRLLNSGTELLTKQIEGVLSRLIAALHVPVVPSIHAIQ
jgi:glycerol-3-phosphate dehydrogenase